ncbi:MAG TPA: GAF domain-containing protein [Oleiagrimonas sp.]|nr:GAF domain-containing protein [Oleiagrimonas sp.]
MFHAQTLATTDKPQAYIDLTAQVRALLEGEHDLIANAANFSALVFHTLPDINWAGFYLFDGHELVVGPFQGQPACIRIALGKGVCGLAAQSRQTQLVADVNAHPNHIFCDSASRAEVVVPLIRADGSLLGVWDVDAPRIGRFDDDDRVGMESLCAAFMAAL